MTFAKAPIRTQRSAFLASETRVRFPDGHGDLRCRISGTFCRWRRRCSATKNKKMMWNSKAVCCLSDQELCLHFGMHNVSAPNFRNARRARPVVALLDDSRKSKAQKRGTACQTNARTSRTKAASKVANRVAVSRADSRIRRISPVKAASRAGKAASVRAASRTARPSRNSFPDLSREWPRHTVPGPFCCSIAFGAPRRRARQQNPPRSPQGLHPEKYIQSTKGVRRAPRKQIQLSLMSCLESE